MLLGCLRHVHGDALRLTSFKKMYQFSFVWFADELIHTVPNTRTALYFHLLCFTCFYPGMLNGLDEHVWTLSVPQQLSDVSLGPARLTGVRLHALYVRQLCRLPTSQHDSAHGSPPSRPSWLTVHVVEPTWGYFSHTYQRTYVDGCAWSCVCSYSCGGQVKRRGASHLFPH